MNLRDYLKEKHITQLQFGKLTGLPEQVEVIPARYLQMRCWNVRDGRGGRSE